MIKVCGLSKHYGATVAVDNIDFEIEKGHIYGFLGPNGAGKTSTLGMITGTLSFTDGRVEICGADLMSDPVAAKKHIGYLPENPPLYPDVTPYEYLRFIAEAKGIKRKEIESAVRNAINLTGITAVQNRLIKNLSKGYKQRTGIAQAIIGDPDIIIFDEPTVALDPKQVVEVRTLIKKLSKNRTVILSSHILSEIEEICDRIIIISSGRIAAKGSLAELQQKYTQNVVLEITAKCKPQKAEEIMSSIKKSEKHDIIQQSDGTVIKIGMPGDKDIRETVFFAFAKAGVPIIGMQKKSLTLEDVFLRATSETHEDETPEEAETAPVKPENSHKPDNDTKGGDDDDDDGGSYRPLFG